MIVPNEPLLKAQAKKLKCEWTVADGFMTSAALVEFIQSRIDSVMQVVSQPERVKRCLLLDKPFQLAADELTATMKVRRRHILAKYERELAALYDAP